MFNETTSNILKSLATGEFCSGQLLGEQNGISRAAIGKHVKALQQLGLDIYSVTGKGYRLSQPVELLDSDIIASFLPFEQRENVAVQTVVGSTNALIKEQIAQGQLSGSGYTLFAEAQTAGRGRRGREWVSPLGSSLFFSSHWRFEQGINATMGLSLAVGIAITEALSELGVQDLGLKWPNDIYYQGKKLAGILIELEAQAADSCDLVIGVGINVQLPVAASQKIDQPFTDLSATGILIGRNELAATILRHLWAILENFESQGFSALITRWNTFDCFKDDRVELKIGQRSIAGIARGVDGQGGIVIELDASGNLQTFYGGEISLRKVT
ncbi:MAG: bifunctional biotin--[acetyl-CoA-carboxylase] ligase/biotin operon repressor BirA [Psychrobium sp.]|nr:bifunctional biotin--[acetyl-CoA-carboxylase] ligase/biotin operon repressor BirA [Psychrobium sp.]